MKKHNFLFFVMAILFCACGNYNNDPDISGGNYGGGGNSGGNVTIDFSIQQMAPFMYKFTNKSKGAESYKWDFGDGSYSFDKDAMYTYSAAGTYAVTLTGTTKNGSKYDCRKTLTVKTPKIYISGYALNKIPYENKYYKVVCKDDDLLTTHWGFSTIYTPLLDNSDIPYICNFQDWQEMTELDGDNYYTFYVYYTSNTSSTSGDTQVLKQKLTKAEILTYQNKHILKSNNGETELAILFSYE